MIFHHHAVKRGGLPVKTVRYCADIGLVQASSRTEAGYRTYDETALRKLVFVRRSRALGFGIEACRKLLSLYQDQGRTSSQVKPIASKRLQEIEEKQRELQSLHDELAHLVTSCRGDDRPDCTIIDYLG